MLISTFLQPSMGIIKSFIITILPGLALLKFKNFIILLKIYKVPFKFRIAKFLKRYQSLFSLKIAFQVVSKLSIIQPASYLSYISTLVILFLLFNFVTFLARSRLSLIACNTVYLSKGWAIQFIGAFFSSMYQYFLKLQKP